ncbi:MAG: hypothetical protein ACLGSA_05055 [Acidobacteriota bacterium]
MYIAHPVPQELHILDAVPAPRPAAAALDEVRAIWESEKLERPNLFNGKIFSLDRMEAGEAHGFLADYSWYVAQQRRPELFGELRVRSLAVSGLVVAGGHMLFGRRKASLAIEGGLWEPAPSGTIPGDLREPDGSLSWRRVFLDELRAELGLNLGSDLNTSGAARLLRPFALIENTATNIWELGVALELDLDHREVLGAWAATTAPEHNEMAAVPLEDVPRFYTERRADMVGVGGMLLAQYGVIPEP